jgi:hypothetical protein
MEMTRWSYKISVKKTINNINIHDEKITTHCRLVPVPVDSNKLKSAKS